MTAKVFVTLKKGVLDPQGKAVEQSLARLGFSEAREVRVGRFIEMAVEAGSREEATKRPQAMPNPYEAPSCQGTKISSKRFFAFFSAWLMPASLAIGNVF